MAKFTDEEIAMIFDVFGIPGIEFIGIESDDTMIIEWKGSKLEIQKK